MYSAPDLLHPVSEAQPAGADLSFSPELDAIAKARQFDDPSLDQGEWVTDLKEADWPFVIERCAHLLRGASKDLRLAVWLTEAGARVHGLRGLGEGYRLLAGLCQQFWEQGLYPPADDGDHEQRAGNLRWILARTPALVREIGQAARQQPTPQFAAAFRADAQSCIDALAQLERVADEKLGQDSPGFAAARDAVAAMLHVLPPPSATAADGGYAGDAGDPADPADGGHGAADAAYGADDGGAGALAGLSRHGAAGQPGAVTNRAQAVAQLRAVAAFFRRTEPHSPASYFAEKAAAAAEQDLHTWLRSVVKDQTSLAHIEELLGVPPQRD